MGVTDRSGSLDFLCISTTGWDEIWGSRQQIMLRLAKAGHRVLFVERQLGWEHIIRYPEFRRMAFQQHHIQPPKKIQENLWRWQPPLVLPGRYYSASLNHFGQIRLVAQLRPVLQQLGFKTPILWMYPPQSAPLIGKFGEWLSIYHCIERFSGEQRGLKKKVMTMQENGLLSKADLVFTHSLGLKQLYGPLCRKPIELVASAADVEHFQAEIDVHPMMAGIPQPRLAVMGTLDTRIDFELLISIANSRRDWHLVLIGQLKRTSAGSSSLLSLANVHFLGPQPYSVLPALLIGADIGLVPYRITEMTRFINPLKAYEYLACGIPVISTQLPELEILSPWVQIIPVKENLPSFYSHFIDGIESALQADNSSIRKERRASASQFSWDFRVERIMEIIWSRR